MDKRNYHPGNHYGYRYTRDKKYPNDIIRTRQQDTSVNKKDEDLIIDENTVYEIDRNCMERLKKNRKRLI